MAILIGVVVSLILLAGMGLFVILAHLAESAHASPLCPTTIPFGSSAVARKSERRENAIADAAFDLAGKRRVVPGQEKADWTAAAEKWDSPTL